jgi:hypothetical protein
MDNLPVVKNDLFFDVARFEHAQRVAKVFANSSMVPKHFQGDLGNCLIAMNLAQRLETDLFMLMQNIYIVGGRPGFQSSLVITLINQSGLFRHQLRFKPFGNTQAPKSAADGCLAYAEWADTGELVEGPAVNWAMVEAEGWHKPRGPMASKWTTLPDLMFRYRAAAFFARTVCPQVLMGLQTAEEINDVEMVRVGPTFEMAPDPAKVLGAKTDKPAAEVYGEIAKDKPAEPSAVTPVPGTYTHPNEAALRKAATNPATGGPVEPRKQTNGEVVNGPQTPPPISQDEPALTVEDWNPMKSPVLQRYVAGKAALLKQVATDMGLQTDGKMPKDVHIEILARANRQPPRNVPEVSEAAPEEPGADEDMGQDPEQSPSVSEMSKGMSIGIALELKAKNPERWAAIVRARKPPSSFVQQWPEKLLTSVIDEFNAIDDGRF